jgi:hypothetical protein
MAATASKNVLLKRIKSEERKWTITTAGWLVLYTLVLMATVALPVIIASKESLRTSVVGNIDDYVPLLALIVALAAALDQKLQSQNRWHWYGDDRDAARQLLVDVEDTEDADEATLKAHRATWMALVKTHNGHRV